MELRDILVHIDSSPQCPERLNVALQVARQHAAHLTGIYVITHPHYLSTDAGTKERVAAAEAKFREQAAEQGVEVDWLAVEWPVTGVDVSEILNLYSHKKDLVIVGQGEPGPGKADAAPDVAERVVRGSGRPVLVVPYAGSFKTIGHRVILAWKDGRASARALGDAIPLLRHASQVCLLSIETDQDQPAVELPQDDIATHLRRHGINLIQERLVTGKIPVADILMTYAWENGCDLLVMGAYAQTPGGALGVGPVARQLFQQMTVPVLMSH